jgi:hypothetical protein
VVAWYYYSTNIERWADAHANLPARARWIAQADVAPAGANDRAQRRPSLETEGFVFSGSTAPPPGLVQAYRETHYRVLGDDGFTLTIDVPSPELAHAHRRHGVDSSAFLTACNPFSRSLSDDENIALQAVLAAALRSLKLLFIDGLGQHPSNGWQGEASFLALGVTRDQACHLGTRFEQNAIVWAGADAVPRLLLLR